MAEYVKVRGLSRTSLRIGSVKVTNKHTVVLNLDDSVTRQAIQRHSALGSLTIVGDVAPTNTAIDVITTGCQVAPRDSGRVLDVAAGTITLAAGTTRAVAGGTVTVTAAHATLPRVDLVSADNTTGALTITAGTARATGPAAPATPLNGVPLAHVEVPPNSAAIGSVNDVRPLP